MRNILFVFGLFLIAGGSVGVARTEAFFADSGITTSQFATGFWVLPTASLASPNGGETLYAGNTHAITWSASSSDPAATSTINLSYSTDGGATFSNTIATGEVNDGSFNWTIPSVASSSVRVQATAVDSHGLSQSDRSNANLTIRSPIVVNEFVPNPTGFDDASMPGGEWVELYNNGVSDVDVNGWILYDNNDTHELFVSTANSDSNSNTADSGETIVPAGGFLVVYRNADSNFELNNTGGDSVRLYTNTISGGGVLIDSYTYTLDPVPNNKSFARIPDGTGNFVDPIPTPGYANQLSQDVVSQATPETVTEEVSLESLEFVLLEEVATSSGEFLLTATEEAQFVSQPVPTEIPVSASVSIETESTSEKPVSNSENPTQFVQTDQSGSELRSVQSGDSASQTAPAESDSAPEESQSSNPEPQSQSENPNEVVEAISEAELISIEGNIGGG